MLTLIIEDFSVLRDCNLRASCKRMPNFEILEEKNIFEILWW